MAEEKTRQKMMELAHWQATLNPATKVPASRAYKDTDRDSTAFKDRFRHLTLAKGDDIVVQYGGRDVKGYARCCILDFEDCNTFWTASTTLIVMVEKVSSEQLHPEIGHLRSVHFEDSSWRHHNMIMVAKGKDAWNEYLVRTP